MIRKATNSDIDSLAKIHSDSLPHSLLPRLGKKFLQEKFYPLMLDSKNALLLVKELKTEVVGFALFAYNGDLLTREIMSHRVSLSKAIIRNVFSDFRIFFAAIRRLKTPAIILMDVKAPKTTDEEKIPPINEMPEFYELAVSSDFRNKAIGTELTQKGLSMLKEKGQTQCIAKPASHIAHNFFLKLGFYDIGKEVRGKGERFIMAYDLV